MHSNISHSYRDGVDRINALREQGRQTPDIDKLTRALRDCEELGYSKLYNYFRGQLNELRKR